MKKLYKNTSEIRLITVILSLLFSFAIHAKDASLRGMVHFVKGNVFAKKDGKTAVLKAGDHLYDFSEVMTETGGQLSFSNYHDRVFHLSGSGFIRIMNNTIELKRGFLWMTDHAESTVENLIHTPNAQVKFNKGESIVSFDPYSGKTDLIVLKGAFEFSNMIQEHLKIEVPAGRFSFINKDYENGAPRLPTPVGQTTFAKVKNLFTVPKGIVPVKGNDSSLDVFMKKDELISANKVVKIKGESVAELDGSNRVPASVSNMPVRAEGMKQGKIIYIRPKRKDVAKESELLNYYNSKVSKMASSVKRPKKTFKPSYEKKSNVAVHIFGKRNTKRTPASVKKVYIPMVKKESTRKPASMAELNPQVEMKNDAFESSLILEYKKQLRHTREVNGLIKELKNYDQDYKEAY